MRDNLCFKAVAIYKQSESIAFSLFKRALQYPYKTGSPWTDAQIYSNMGMSCGDDYIKAYSYLQKAVDLGLVNGSIIKEMNWIEIHYGNLLGKEKDTKKDIELMSYWNERYINDEMICNSMAERKILLSFSDYKKRLTISIMPALTKKYATLVTRSSSCISDSYMGDNPNYIFTIDYDSTGERIECVKVYKRDTNTTYKYSELQEAF